MKKLFNYVLPFFVLICLSCGGNKYHNVSKYDVAGVELNMPMDKAVKIIKKHLDMEPSEENTQNHPITGEPIATNYTFYGPESIVNLTGVIEPGRKKKKAVVYKIEYELRKDTEAARQLVADRALKKYGKPSFGESFGSSHSYSWCAKPTEKETQCDIRTAKIIVSNNDLEMQDLRILEESRTYYEKKTAGKVNF